MKIRINKFTVYAGHTVFAMLVAAASFLFYSGGIRGFYFILFFVVIFVAGIPILNFIYQNSDKVRFSGKDTAVSPENVEFLFQTSSLDSILGITFERLRSLFGAQQGIILIYNLQNRSYEVYEQSSRGRSIDKSAVISNDNPLLRILNETRKPVFRKKLDPLIGYDLRICDVMDEFNAVVAAPIAFSERFIGALMLGGCSESFSLSETEIINSFAAKIGVVYMNSYLWKEAIFRKDVEKEYELGKRTQNNFLPPNSGVMGGFEFYFVTPEHEVFSRRYYDLYSEYGDLFVSVFRNYDVKPGAFVFLPSLIPILQTYFRQYMNPEKIIKRVTRVVFSQGVIDGKLELFAMQLSRLKALWSGSGVSVITYNTQSDGFSVYDNEHQNMIEMTSDTIIMIIDRDFACEEEHKKVLHERFRINKMINISSTCEDILREVELRTGKRCFLGLLRRAR